MDILIASFGDFGALAGQIFSAARTAWFIVLPPMLFALFKFIWLDERIGSRIASTPNVLLEIIPPREIEKSPQLMEALFDGIAGTDQGYTIYEQVIDGEIAPQFSFEIAGHEGTAHFYVRTPIIFRKLIEAHLYAQYPDIEITEVEDYVNEVPKNIPNKDWDLFGFDFILNKPDAWPIKTYHYFEESVTGKMIDPLSGVLEVIGKLTPGQRIWLQFIISPERPHRYAKDKLVVEEIVKGAKTEEAGPIGALFFHLGDIFRNVFKGLFGPVEFSSLEKKEAKDLGPVEFRLTPTQKRALEALENNIGRNMFKVRMRLVYFGRRENFTKTYISTFIGAIKQFNDNNFNSMIPEDFSKTSVKYLFAKERLAYRQRKLFTRYIRRNRDPEETMFALSTAEMATVFHVPDGSVAAPALSRVAAKRSGAPSNLPVE